MSQNDGAEEVVADDVDETIVDDAANDGANDDDSGKADDGTDWKAKFEEAEGKRKRLETKLNKGTEKKPTGKSDDLDYGQKAFLIANGVKEADEIALVKDMMANTGKTLDDVIGSKYFQSELSEMRELRATSAATPKGSKRNGQSAQDSVEYWIAKGELPPASERELRQKVVNARMKAETNKSVFTDNPVVR